MSAQSLDQQYVRRTLRIDEGREVHPQGRPARMSVGATFVIPAFAKVARIVARALAKGGKTATWRLHWQDWPKVAAIYYWTGGSTGLARFESGGVTRRVCAYVAGVDKDDDLRTTEAFVETLESIGLRISSSALRSIHSATRPLELCVVMGASEDVERAVELLAGRVAPVLFYSKVFHIR